LLANPVNNERIRDRWKIAALHASIIVDLVSSV
jgi:hypothetical protein